MNRFLQEQATAYLHKTLGIKAIFAPYTELDKLPHHITKSYKISQCTLMDRTLIALQRKDATSTPTAMAKHANWLHQKTGHRSLFLLETVAAYERKRLIEDKIPFLAPDRQLYLPDLGLDLHEQFKTPKQQIQMLSPSTQVIVLACLLHRLDPDSEFTGAGLAKQFGYSKMTMTRALGELRELRLVEQSGERRFARHRFLVTAYKLWENTRSVLRTPVKRRVYIEEKVSCGNLKAGESALADLTMLGAPQRTTWAITSAEWANIQKTQNLHEIPEISKDMARTEFEIWHYDPRLLAKEALVDPFSLILSLQSTKDDRIQIAIDELQVGVKW